MDRTFELNGKTIVAKPFTFNTIIDLESMGINIQDAAEKPMGLLRGYIALCLGSDLATAGAELESHIINGGGFEIIMNAMTEELQASDFFRAMGNQGVPEKVTTGKGKKTKKTTENA